MLRLIAEIEPVHDRMVTWSLRRDGDDWLLEAGPERARMRAARGFEHLCVLLATPERDVAAQENDGADGSPPAQTGLPILDQRAGADLDGGLTRSPWKRRPRTAPGTSKPGSTSTRSGKASPPGLRAARPGWAADSASRGTRPSGRA